MRLARDILLSNIIWLAYKALTFTWRLRIIESPEFRQLKNANQTTLIGMWHGDELAIVPFCRFYKVATLTSTSKDGELMDRVLKKLGVATSRGSSTRGGARALVGLIRLTREGWNPVIPVDGPKGPIYKAKPGIFELAKVSEKPIVPVGAAASRAWVFHKSWNKAYLPKPFARVVLVWGVPYTPNKELDPRDSVLAHELESKIDAVGKVARENLDTP